MPSTRVFRGSFVGGEISPEMFGRIDDSKFQNGAASIENFIATPLGAAEKRPGFAFVATTKNNGAARLIPFTYSVAQTMVIEVGAGYFRFHTNGETLIRTVTPYIGLNIVTIAPANPALVNWPNHGLITGEQVGFQMQFRSRPIGQPWTPPTMPAGMTAGIPYFVTVTDSNNFKISLTSGGAFIATTDPGSGVIEAYGWYVAGQVVTYGGFTYTLGNVVSGYASPPPSYGWTLGTASGPYEVANSYAAADLMNLHFVQSADVLTLVHPNYPPSELRRLGATTWTFAAIAFGQVLSAPAGLAVVPTLGYSAQIASIATSVNPLITTVANHSLALGDGVYIKGLTATLTGGGTRVVDGFWMVSLVPHDGSGNLITTQLYLEDYSGNPLDSSNWASYTPGATMQYGTQIVDITNKYVVTAMASDGIQQSVVSAQASVLNNLYVTGSYNTLTWAAVPGASLYYVYKMKNGLFGFIGNTPTLTFADTNISADMSITPDNFDAVFASSGNYPAAVSYYQQRRCFGGTNIQPQNFWMTKTGTESDMSYSLPVQATDRIAIAIATREMSTILHIVPLLQLVLLTSSCEISASPTNSDTITPSTISARPQSYIGSSNVQPSVINNTMVFCAARGGHVREMGYQWQIGGYLTGDISLRAAHLFDGFQIVDQAFAKAPWPIIWFVSSSGNLLGLTYVPEEQVGAWHHHTTDGTFKSVAVVAEGAEDHLYAIITRQINGNTVNCIERMSARLYGAPKNAFYVDCGGTFDGTNTAATTMTVSGGTTWGPADTLTLTASSASFANTDIGSVVVLNGADGVTVYRLTVKVFTSSTSVQGVITKTLEAGMQGVATATWAWARPTIAGLTWLVGKTVSVLVDGAVEPQCVVSNAGTIALQRPGVVVQVGLPYTAEIDTLPLVLQVDGSGQGRNKNINKVWVKLFQSGAVFAGPSGGSLVEYKQRMTEAYGAPPALMTKEIELTIPPTWQPDGTLTISQSTPLPLTVVGITAEVSLGG